MSASREKKTRQGSTYAQQRNNRAEQSSKAKRVIYIILGVVIAALAVALLVWDSGFFQKRAVALTVDGEDYTVADVQFYYNSFYNETARYAQVGMVQGFDSSVDPKDQIQDEETGTTWHDYFLQSAIDQLTQNTMIRHEAEEQGYTLSALGQAYVDQQLEALKSTARSSGYSVNSYLHMSFGPYVDMDTCTEMITNDAIAYYYQLDRQNGLTYTDEELEAYYQEHADELDTYNYSVLTIQANVPTETDEEGNTVEMTDEEKQAAFDTAKAEAQALAQELQQKVSSGSDMQALADEYADQLFSSTVHSTAMGNSNALSSAPYTEWLSDSARQNGDVSIQENDRSDSYVYNYYVVQFEGRQRDESATADVRHIFVSAGSTPTDETFATAEETAQTLLDQFQSGSATEEDFAIMALQNTADTSSSASGGLYTGVSASSGFVDTFTDWCLDSSRQPGDTGLVKNEGSSSQGWHVMYFVGWDDPTWKLSIRSTKASEDMTQWLEELTADVEATQGSGMKYVA